MNDATQNVIDALDKMDELQERAAKTRRDLRRSLAIKQLWPDAFDVPGGVSSVVSGYADTELVFTVKRKDGKKRRFDLTQVPFCLWQDDVKDHIRKQCGRARLTRNKYFIKLKEHEGD